MPEWLTESLTVDTPALPLDRLILRLLTAALYGGCVALSYRLSHGRLKSDSAVLVSTLVLLSILIAMVSMVIGESVARAFSLVGALSIVRFRTVVDDTRDTAFVIFAVIVGMAAGAGLFLVPLVGIPIVAAAAVLLSYRNPDPVEPIPRPTAAESSLSIRLGLGREPETLFQKTFDQYLASHRLTKVETARQGAVIDLSYRVRLQPSAATTAFVTALNQTDGVQSVELRMEG